MAVNTETPVSVRKIPWSCNQHLTWNLECGTCKGALALREATRIRERREMVGRDMRQARS